MIVVILIIIIIAVVIVSRYTAYGKVKIKDFLIPSSFFIIAAVFVVFMVSLQKSAGNCKVNIIIENKDSISEIKMGIEGESIYYLSEDKKLEINSLYSEGQMVVKTVNGAKLIEFVDSRHFFSFDHYFIVMINNNDIDIKNNSPLSIEISDISIEEFEQY